MLENGAYGFGKQIARLAQLAHIASVIDAANDHELDHVVEQIKSTNGTASARDSGAVISGTTRRAFALLEKYLGMWLIGDGHNEHLVFDADFGGVLSKEGTKDINSDFGNARYNGELTSEKHFCRVPSANIVRAFSFLFSFRSPSRSSLPLRLCIICGSDSRQDESKLHCTIWTICRCTLL